MTQTIEPRPHHIPLTRENLRSGRIRDWIKQHDPNFEPMAEEEVTASRHNLFGGKPPSEDVWLFGYGSLIWNPTIEFDEKRCGTVFGVHRRFCLETHLGRGTPDFPGLTLGLDRGGSCRGVAFRIPGRVAEDELDLVWRREMITNAYRPAWLNVRTDDGPVKAVGFVINRSHQRYCGARGDDDIAETIAKAHGFLGPCCEYLFNTVEHLAELKIPDAGLTRLAAKVARVQAATSTT
jgi:cation transport protein ChaC